MWKLYEITGFVRVVKKSTSCARTHNILKTGGRVYRSVFAIVILSAKRGQTIMKCPEKKSSEEGRGVSLASLVSHVLQIVTCCVLGQVQLQYISHIQ